MRWTAWISPSPPSPSPRDRPQRRGQDNGVSVHQRRRPRPTLRWNERRAGSLENVSVSRIGSDLHAQHAVLAQKAEQRQQWQAEYREEIALHAIEKLRAPSFQTVSPDAAE